MDFELIQRALPILLMGVGVTIEITAFSVAIGFFIGLFVGIARISQFKILRIMAAVYADCIRGTPLLVQIFLIYFALPMAIQKNGFVNMEMSFMPSPKTTASSGDSPIIFMSSKIPFSL